MALERAATEFHSGLKAFRDEAESEREYNVSSVRIFRQLLDGLMQRTDALLSECRDVELDTDMGKLARFFVEVQAAHDLFSKFLPVVAPPVMDTGVSTPLDATQPTAPVDADLPVVTPTTMAAGISTPLDTSQPTVLVVAELDSPSAEIATPVGKSIATKSELIAAAFDGLITAVTQELPKYSGLADDITVLLKSKQQLVLAFKNDAAEIERQLSDTPNTSTLPA